MTIIAILAAGQSSRLGRPKQTLLFKQQSLLQHSIHAATTSGIGPVIVVVGANEKDIRRHIEAEPVTIVANNDFEEGIASSIRAAISHILQIHPDCHSVVLMVCDQPFVSGRLLTNLVSLKQKTGKAIVACSYKNSIGVPALFDKCFFPELLLLTGEQGGKKVLSKHQTDVTTLPFAEGDIDIDTNADYEALLNVPSF